MQIITHRGLEPLNKEFNFIESSKEAFENQLKRWYSLEFDANFCWDWFWFVFHDSNLSRITNNIDTRDFSELTKKDITNYTLPNNNHFIWIIELFELIDKYRISWEYSALHLKSKYQKQEYINKILNIFKIFPWIEEKIFIFDLTISTAEYIKSKNKNIKIFASISHEYDIERYNEYTWWTLLSISDFLNNKNLFEWVWLDEWDRTDKNWTKSLYSKEIFNIFRNEWKLIWLVTPELHSKSPWLLGWESHQDCRDIEVLKKRFKEILKLNPDFICSDYLEFIS